MTSVSRPAFASHSLSADDSLAAPAERDIAPGGEHATRTGTGGRSSEVERQLPKLNVVGSIPIARSRPCDAGSVRTYVG